jgi:hypothetical protein
MLIPLKLPPIPLARQIRPGQVDRYEVESDWNGSGNAAGYRYQMVIEAARYVEKKQPEAVDFFARMMDLRMTRNGEEVPRVKLAGAFGFKLRANGGPDGLHTGGNAATLGLPLLGWYLPPTVPTEERFPVTGIAVEDGVFADGWGRLVSLKEGIAKFSFELGIGPAGTPGDQRVVRYRGVSFVRLKTGRVESSEGDVVDPNGTLSFKIRRR